MLALYAILVTIALGASCVQLFVFRRELLLLRVAMAKSQKIKNFLYNFGCFDHVQKWVDDRLIDLADKVDFIYQKMVEVQRSGLNRLAYETDEAFQARYRKHWSFLESDLKYPEEEFNVTYDTAQNAISAGFFPTFKLKGRSWKYYRAMEPLSEGKVPFEQV